MKINLHKVRHLHGQKLPLEESYRLPRLVERSKDLVDIGLVRFKGFGEMNGNLFVVKGELTGTLTLVCSRCLAETEHSFHQELEERFNLDPTYAFEASKEEEEEIHPVESSEIDLLPLIEEQVLLAIPPVPTCPGECANQLPTEGPGWSVIDEQEKKQMIDPRLAKLQKFFEKK